VTERRKRWLRFLFAIAVGLGLGLFYGWVVNPVQVVDTTPATLRQDYKTDFVLMVAEGYHLDGDLDKARQYLALLGEEPATVTAQALQYATEVGYAPPDLYLMRDLLMALRQAAPASPKESP